jgi:hypothetical protein
MDGKEEPISVLVIVAVSIVLYALWQRGAIDMTALGSAIAAGAVAIILGVFWWGWKGRIERRLNQSNNSDNLVQHIPESVNRAPQKEELDLLIKPLYLAFDKYPDDPKMMHHTKTGLPMIWSLMSSPYQKSEKYLGIEKAAPVIDTMQQHGNLAQPTLRELIKQFLDFKQKQRENIISIRDPYFIDTSNKVDQIKDLVIIRYNELMWGKKEI